MKTGYDRVMKTGYIYIYIFWTRNYILHGRIGILYQNTMDVWMDGVI
jgi:hypothetical protein